MSDENAPLLPRVHFTGEEPRAHNVRRELILLSTRAVPITFTFALQNAVQICSVSIAGTIDAFSLDVASYGFMFFSCTGTMVAIGGATALDTLCGQALTSSAASEDPHVLDLLLLQSVSALGLLFGILIAPIWAISGQIFLALGQEHEFAVKTGRFMIMMIPAGACQVISECLKKFLQVQGRGGVVGWIILGTSVMGVLVTSVLVRCTSLGIWSVPFAFGIYQVTTVVSLLVTMFSTKVGNGVSKKSMSGITRGLPLLLWYACTGILTIATEWWSFEILAMMAARLDLASVGAQSILMSSDLLFTTVSLGISVAASHRIGGLLGADLGSSARNAAAAPFLLAILVGIVESGAIILARNHFGRLFTSDEAVIEKTAGILPLMAGFQFLDLANGAAGGILRGSSRNHLSGACNFLAYYAVGLSSSWIFCFHLGYGLYGLWAGIITGSGALLVLQSFCVGWTPWDELGQKISQQYRT